ncbi:hypothetical protein FS837_005372 [Tulasnella sp. UAMH 9824]|nr:hypothetical protein FS837_005372 [Tulasnella sp. UAMH 9824]
MSYVPPHTTPIPTPGGGPANGPRTLVLCFDESSNGFDHEKNSNVVLLCQMLKRDGPRHQLFYYQTGIGSYTSTGFISARVAQALDKAFAWYLEDHVFLMNAYRAGDKICLFGFDRGAYTAKALAAMLYRVGLLPRYNLQLLSSAYKIFKESKNENKIMEKDPEDARGYVSKDFRRIFSREVTIEFVGIWDAVPSVGFISRSLPNPNKNPIVKHVRHAIALDERRAKSKAAHWDTLKEDRDKSTLVIEGNKDQEGIDQSARTVEEVWFAGGHADVGGGWEGDRVSTQLSRIPLRWIVREATLCSSIIWDEAVLKRFKVRKPENEREIDEYIRQEKADALAKCHTGATAYPPFGWLLEFWPLAATIRFFGLYFKILFPKAFRARRTRKPNDKYPTKIHSSVKTRLKHFKDPLGEPYRNAAEWDANKTEFVDEWALPAMKPN